MNELGDRAGASIGGSDQGPLVSVIMNCYNGEKYLRDAIESVLHQSYRNWEIVFWDNRSADRSAEIFKSYDDHRLKYFCADRHTVLYAARNLAVKKATGDLIAFLDVDDWWHEDKLAMQVPLFEDPEVALAYGNYWRYDERTETRTQQYVHRLPEGSIVEALLRRYVVGMPTLVVRRKAIDDLPEAFDPRFNLIGDFDLAVRLARTHKTACIQSPIAYYRWHGDNLSATQLARYAEETEIWLSESSLPEEQLRYVRYDVTRNKAISALDAGDFLGAARQILVPAGLLKFRLLAAVGRHLISGGVLSRRRLS